MTGWLVFTFYIFIPFAQGHNFRLCELALNSSAESLQIQMAELNPSLLDGLSGDLSELYLKLKDEEWIYAPIPIDRPPRLLKLPEQLKHHLLQTFSDRYELRSATDETLTRFYINGLRGIYSKVGDRIRKEKVKQLFAEPLAYDEQIVMEALLSSFWTPKNLQDRELSPEQARGLLSHLHQISYPWSDALLLVRIWNASGRKFSQRDFKNRWARGLSTDLAISEAQVHQLAFAMDLVSYFRNPICCVSTPGCHDCPLNRRSLIRK